MQRILSTASGSDRCIVSFACNGREAYCDAQKRLLDSLKSVKWSEGVIFKSSDNGEVYPYSITFGKSPTHKSVPYAFKPFLIQEAYEAGYNKILWVDSTIVAHKHPELFFELMDIYPVIACENIGFPLKDWVTDWVVDKLSIDVQEAKQIMGCVVGFNLHNDLARHCFSTWLTMAIDGHSFKDNERSNRDGFIHTRHDQSCLSAIMHKLQLPILPYGLVAYSENRTDESIFVNTGIT